ncbi:matrixin family metalloprotease [Halobellus rufus]|uniref:matrixin family metalloprotease n=1 Tax=Halobellus rufus TaxID=1448860 RepID=UPI000679791F|nr:matrixin family metalloprotease [Halobellus rufus]
MPKRSRGLVVVSLALLIAIAGCAGSAVDLPSTGIGGDEGTSTLPVGQATETADSTSDRPSATPTAIPDGSNPWGTEPVVVAVCDTAGTDREWTPLVAEATAYWETNADRFAGFPVDYEVRPDASDPDVVVEFVDEVPECDDSTDAAGCAPLIEDSRQIDRPETVYVRTGFSDNSTVRVLEHEFGHTLGLTHDDEPAEIMTSQTVLYTEPQTDATERDFPWRDADFTVYVDDENASDPDGMRTQVRHALEYYEDGPDGEDAPEGMPSNLSFTTVEDPDDADIVIRPVESSPCGDRAASCGATAGEDPDGDGAIETYTSMRISLVDLDTDAVGWHVGYWLAYGLGAEDDADKPSPFRDASYEERRSEWWE